MRARPPAFGEIEVAPAGGPAPVEADACLAVPGVADPAARTCMIRKLVEQMDYTRSGGRNRLTVRIRS